MPTLKALAARAGTSREAVARALSQLTLEGSIRRKGHTLYIE